MKLSDIASRLSGTLEGAELDVSRVTGDSRDVRAGDLFVAVRGLRADGHEFVGKAIAAGAAAVVLERAVEDANIPTITVEDGAVALGEATAALAGDPAKKMRLVGITGTNGKTTTSFLVESIIDAAGRAPGVIGTVSYRYAGKDVAAPYTTPTPEVLHSTFADMAECGVEDAVLEVSSVALSMHRLAGTEFEVAAFTNLSQDHLDVHGDMATYSAAKAMLFGERLSATGVAVINIDADGADEMLTAARSNADRRILRVSCEPNSNAEVRVVDSSMTIAGVSARIATPRGEIDVECAALIGHYNVANVALAVGIGEALGIDHQAIARGIAHMAGVPGRVERVTNDHDLDILVDYAHTPDALANVLDALRPLCKRRLICVFGCGGDRDPSKRPKMGAAVAERADVVIVTSDNPRTEEPHSIIDMILPAVPAPFFVEVQRDIAIKAAVLEAAPGDIVLIAGKGHEDYQILGTTKIHFDDREHAAAAAAERQAITLEDVAEATQGAAVGGDGIGISRVIIDGRQAAPGDLYVAIRGERFDGHDFIDQAREHGASASLVERGTALPAGAPAVTVDDTRIALGALARWVRREWGQTVVGVTGSAGKTTTRELIAAATRTLHPLASKGSFNNETGLPLTLLGLKPYHQLAITEMGMRGLGQIDYLCSIAEPNVGVVVNAGVAHLGVIGSKEDIVRGKSEVYGRLPDDGTAIYPADDPRLARFALAAPNHVSFGEAENADVRLLEYRSLGTEGSALRISVDGDEHDVKLSLYGKHNALNASCAVAVALTVGVSIEDALAGLASARAPGLRGQRIVVSGRNLLVDCYNSNPNALEAALETTAELAGHSGSRGFAVIGDMLELGDAAIDAHRDGGRRAGELSLGVVALGEFAESVIEGARSGGDADAAVAATPKQAAEAVLGRSKPGDWILFKASRGAKLEKVVEAVRELAGT